MIRKLFLLLLVFIPLPIWAAELTFQSVTAPTLSGGRPTIEVWLDPQGKALNAVEGIIYLKSSSSTDIAGVQIDSKNSILNLWPAPPEYSVKDKVIRFAGGNADGFNQKSLLLSLQAYPTKSGQITFSWLGGEAYLSDGQGTREFVSARSLAVALTPALEPLQESLPQKKEEPRLGWLNIRLLIIILGGIIFLTILYGYKKFFHK